MEAFRGDVLVSVRLGTLRMFFVRIEEPLALTMERYAEFLGARIAGCLAPAAPSSPTPCGWLL